MNWKEREAELRELVAKGMTDAEIADHYGLTPSGVWYGRKVLRIDASERGEAQPAAGQPEPVRTYTDEHGRTIRVYPARYAVGMQPFTVRPGGRRRGG